MRFPGPTGAPRQASGQGVAEFALAVPVMLVLIFGILDFGRAIYALNTISGAARTGARVAIINQSSSTDCTVVPLPAKCAAINVAVGLGLTTDAVDLAYSHSNGSGTCNPKRIGCTASATVTYEFVPVTPVIGTIIGPITLSSTTELSIERQYENP